MTPPAAGAVEDHTQGHDTAGECGTALLPPRLPTAFRQTCTVDRPFFTDNLACSRVQVNDFTGAAITVRGNFVPATRP